MPNLKTSNPKAGLQAFTQKMKFYVFGAFLNRGANYANLNIGCGQ
jgi:hypothetical protein